MISRALPPSRWGHRAGGGKACAFYRRVLRLAANLTRGIIRNGGESPRLCVDFRATPPRLARPERACAAMPQPPLYGRPDCGGGRAECATSAAAARRGARRRFGPAHSASQHGGRRAREHPKSARAGNRPGAQSECDRGRVSVCSESSSPCVVQHGARGGRCGSPLVICQHFPLRVSGEMGADPCPQAEAGPTAP